MVFPVHAQIHTIKIQLEHAHKEWIFALDYDTMNISTVCDFFFSYFYSDFCNIILNPKADPFTFLNFFWTDVIHEAISKLFSRPPENTDKSLT